MSDVQSLTLPKPGTLTRVRRRKRKRPPNWKRLLAGMVWDVVVGGVWLADFVSDGNLIDVLAAMMFALDLAIQIRRWRRPDGEFRWAEDRAHVMLSASVWVFVVVAVIAGWL